MKYYTDGKNNYYRLGKLQGFYVIQSADPTYSTKFETYAFINGDDTNKEHAEKFFMNFVAQNNLFLAEMPALVKKEVVKRVPKIHKNGKIMISSSSVDDLIAAIHRNLGWNINWRINKNTLLFENDTASKEEVDERNKLFFVTVNKNTMRWQLRMDLDAEKMKGVKTAVCGRKRECKSVVKQLENSFRRML